MSDLLTFWFLPAIFSAAAVTAWLPGINTWRIAKLATTLALLVASVSAIIELSRFFVEGQSQDSLGLLMVLLVSLLSWVIVRFSANYLAGESGQRRFVRAMLFTLACVAWLVTSHNLLIIAIAWSATSIGMHTLLTFYPQRKSAQLVAHKKFIVSRLADLCLIGALVLVYQSVGSWQLDAIGQHLVADGANAPLLWVAVLIALAAILKTAQLPLHGWLIQVMEAPTPVSALLHAGVVNMGGFVLIRMADVIGAASIAQWILIFVGSLTALLAGLVMMTRISIKVRLAWSTCAQMGFMLLEIGLGLYELALLHLVAHSLYKAHAFLSSGQAVQQTFEEQLQGRYRIGSAASLMLAPIATAAIVIASTAVWHFVIDGFELAPVVVVILAFGFAPLMWPVRSGAMALLSMMRVALLTQVYLLFHLLFAQAISAEPLDSSMATAWVVGVFLLLYLTQGLVCLLSHHPLVARLYNWAYHGFFLDETFTRLTFKYWPARFSPSQAQTWVLKQPRQWEI
ncbi:NADH-quinone oxidoreductase subunit L [Vibrio sinaloensis]|uniref:NADH-quinone oxidoreductase subunit L n=1 Tax=Photobacterium sp. (strain ATCC 43367) TaxID=379097 RepID=UPI00205AEA60|nr:NADH-quinone oxidoreductase subunit L [Vibrio sinaloensis]UPQ87047.1 NADH-quinone oxidoreductase subunit L [Vibrio sinaloensis]